MQINLNSFRSVLLLLFSFSLVFTLIFIMGCGDEGDSPTEMVTGEGDKTEPTEPTVPPDQPDPPPVVPEEPKVSFKDEISPILAETCAIVNCHVANGAGGLDLTEYDTFKDGGNRGPAFEAGNADGSLVIKYIKGEMQPQMPIGGAPLNAEQINLFVDWINEGAENN
ncbi:hypothetical protein C6497_08360 [Candidatus Poribacteria bacterium]|nr:MAG: hypothetical protein C6497_08360 [Candidatus Poribacteria bacterium]